MTMKMTRIVRPAIVDKKSTLPNRKTRNTVESFKHWSRNERRNKVCHLRSDQLDETSPLSLDEQVKKTLPRPPVDASSSDEERPKKIAKVNQRKEKLNVDEVFSSSSSDEDDHRRSLSVENNEGKEPRKSFSSD